MCCHKHLASCTGQQVRYPAGVHGQCQKHVQAASHAATAYWNRSGSKTTAILTSLPGIPHIVHHHQQALATHPTCQILSWHIARRTALQDCQDLLLPCAHSLCTCNAEWTTFSTLLTSVMSLVLLKLPPEYQLQANSSLQTIILSHA